MGTTRLPALGLEDTAERIEAACAAREPKVDPWEASLPSPMQNHTDRASNALRFIGTAMLKDPALIRAANVRRAAAEVRAWRLSLPEDQQGRPIVLTARYSVRNALGWAAQRLIDADRAAGGTTCGHNLRGVEAYLRAAGEALVRLGAE